MTLTAKGARWLHRWQVAKRVAVWTFLLACCLATLALFVLAGAQCFTGPRATP